MWFRFRCQIQPDYIFLRIEFLIDLTQTRPVVIPKHYYKMRVSYSVEAEASCFNQVAGFHRPGGEAEVRERRRMRRRNCFWNDMHSFIQTGGMHFFLIFV
jgi:hypothetical protein